VLCCAVCVYVRVCVVFALYLIQLRTQSHSDGQLSVLTWMAAKLSQNGAHRSLCVCVYVCVRAYVCVVVRV